MSRLPGLTAIAAAEATAVELNPIAKLMIVVSPMELSLTNSI